MAETAVGPGWATREDLEPAPGRLVVVGELDGRVAGVATARVDGPEGFRTHRMSLVRESLSPVLVADAMRVVLLDLAVVAPAARRRGLYGAPLRARTDWGAAQGASVAVAFGWTPPDGCHIAPAMESAGFERLALIEGFFHDASLGVDAICPECGPPPCSCAAVLFARPVDPT